MAQEKVDGLRACGAQPSTRVVAGRVSRVGSRRRLARRRRDERRRAQPAGLRRRERAAASSATSPTFPISARSSFRRSTGAARSPSPCRPAGASPALAQHLRDRFAAQVGFEHEQLAGELQRIRPWVKQNLHTYEERRDYFRERVAEALG